MSNIPIRSFHLSTPEQDLQDLKRKLELTRWPSAELEPDWREGPPIAAVTELCAYWQTSYDWRKCEDWFNTYPQFTAHIDGLDIHYLHIKSKHTNALPMLMIHGWPGSVLEFHKVVEPFISASANHAFDLIIPSLPGYGWSSKPNAPGWSLKRIAEAFIKLMNDGLKLDRWVAQGGDWGADIVALIGNIGPSGLIGVHMNSAFFNARLEIRDMNAMEAGEDFALRKQEAFETDGYAYFSLQRTRPQTLAYALADSPVAQASWVYEKIHGWCQDPSVLTKDEILDNIMVYWLSNSGGSSARLYKEDDTMALKIDIPVGVSVFPGDINYAPRSWGERYYSNIVHWRDVEQGGHFAAWEVPDIFVREVRETFKQVR